MKRKREFIGGCSQKLMFLFLTSLTMVFSSVFSPNISASLVNKLQESVNIPSSNEILATRPHSSEMKEIIGRLNNFESNFLAVNNRVEGQQQDIIFLKSVLNNRQNEKEINYSEESEVFPVHHKREKRETLNSPPQCSIKACAFDMSTKSKIVVKKPSSCEDLKSIGHSLSGFYMIQATGEDNSTLTNKILTVYCDFTVKKLPTTLKLKGGITEYIGYVDIQSLAHGIHFYVQRNSTFVEKKGTNITFQLEYSNVGGAINLTTGIFTAPVSGKYFFSFSAIKGRNINSGTEVYLYHNNQLIGAAYGTVGQKTTLVLQSVLQLESGDVVYLQKGLGDTILYEKLDNEKHERTTHFAGWLLEESSKSKNEFPSQ